MDTSLPDYPRAGAGRGFSRVRVGSFLYVQLSGYFPQTG
jgi:hypothetical protein